MTKSRGSRGFFQLEFILQLPTHVVILSVVLRAANSKSK